MWSINDDMRNIFELQVMLRELNRTLGIRLINPDGIFDHETTEAVTQVQKIAGIEPPNGEVDSFNMERNSFFISRVK